MPIRRERLVELRAAEQQVDAELEAELDRARAPASGSGLTTSSAISRSCSRRIATTSVSRSGGSPTSLKPTTGMSSGASCACDLRRARHRRVVVGEHEHEARQLVLRARAA